MRLFEDRRKNKILLDIYPPILYLIWYWCTVSVNQGYILAVQDTLGEFSCCFSNSSAIRVSKRTCCLIRLTYAFRKHLATALTLPHHNETKNFSGVPFSFPSLYIISRDIKNLFCITDVLKARPCPFIQIFSPFYSDSSKFYPDKIWIKWVNQIWIKSG